MKKFIAALVLAIVLAGCTSTESAQIVATTLPVYEFTSRICQGTDLKVTRLITESVSCLHDYSLQVSQMQALEGATVTIINGAGLEMFLDDVLHHSGTTIDASSGIELHCPEDAHGHSHDHEGHHHEQDSHIWLSPRHAMVMAQNICDGLVKQYPNQKDLFETNLQSLLDDLQRLQTYAENQLEALRCRKIITFHDGFGYFAEEFDLTILRAVEEESGSEASAAELIELIQMVEGHRLPAIFTETNGADSAAKTIASETGCRIFTLDMAMAGDSYFDAMYHNIDTIKEALG